MSSILSTESESAFYQGLLSPSIHSVLLQMDLKHFGVKMQHPSQMVVHCQSERLKISQREPGKTEVMMLYCDMKTQTQNVKNVKKNIMNTQFLVACEFISALFTFFSGLRRMRPVISVFICLLGKYSGVKN